VGGERKEGREGEGICWTTVKLPPMHVMIAVELCLNGLGPLMHVTTNSILDFC